MMSRVRLCRVESSAPEKWRVVFPQFRVLVLANQKGGVGKTTTAINLGTALAAIGERVLIIDLDPQGNASTGLGIDRRSRGISTFDVMIGEEPLKAAVQATAVPRLSIAPSTLDLLGVELEIAARKGSRLSAEDGHPTSRQGAGKRARGIALHLCSHRLPALAQSSDHQCAGGERQRARAIAMRVLRARRPVADSFDRRAGEADVESDLSIHGIVLTMYDPRNNLATQVVADVRGFMGDKVYETIIPRNVRISEAPSYGKPVLLYDLKCSGSQAYLRLASEVIQRERQLRAA